jgi:hypothetical protein
LPEVLEDMRKYVRAGFEALSSQGAEDAAGAIMSRASVLAEQLSAFASGFLEWSAEARASLLQEVKDMITRQVESMGLASKEDVDSLRRRVARLEGRAAGAKGSSTPARRTAKGPATPARTTAKASSRRTAKASSRRKASRTTGAAVPATARRAGSRSGASASSRGSRRPASE